MKAPMTNLLENTRTYKYNIRELQYNTRELQVHYQEYTSTIQGSNTYNTNEKPQGRRGYMILLQVQYHVVTSTISCSYKYNTRELQVQYQGVASTISSSWKARKKFRIFLVLFTSYSAPVTLNLQLWRHCWKLHLNLIECCLNTNTFFTTLTIIVCSQRTLCLLSSPCW